VILESRLFAVKRYCPPKLNTCNREQQHISDFHISKQKQLPSKCFVTVIPTLNVICQEEMHEKLSSKNALHNISHRSTEMVDPERTFSFKTSAELISSPTMLI
jgi:hypothetical protein